ncbi:carbon-nitrogen hydrolase family protein [Nesterenkonia populi]|uniref:carbon-nitrogen hydrolase family protein n=1 Tax=Nesterenkonia populi TaxID=1591087 RepID=UPI00147891D4|nr:carbon-nitrogen hydrolase family protein [Nesterenkonia populi]
MSGDLATAESFRAARLGVVQMEAAPGEEQANVAQAQAYVEQLAAQGIDLIVLPELFITGYDLSYDLSALADPPKGPHTQLLSQWARQYEIIIVTALLAKTHDGDLLDWAVVVDETGTITGASKQYLWGKESQKFITEPGPAALAPTRIGMVGAAICYEAGFPEVVRDLALRGAEIIGVPAAFGRERLYAWDLLTRSRALENGCFLAAAGLTGTNPSGVKFAAHSRLVSTKGEVLAGLGENPGVASASVDLGDISRSRGAIPYLKDLTSPGHYAPAGYGER